MSATRRFGALLILGLLAPVLRAGDTPASDLDRIQGEWVAKAGPAGDVLVKLKVADRDARFTVTLPSGLVIKAKGKITLDETTQPARLDWSALKLLDGQPVPNVPGIYRLDVADSSRLTVCTGGPLGKRPADFQAGESPLAALVTFERPAGEAIALESSPRD
jgi:uncharacterized protein (TIGR03067 family)